MDNLERYILQNIQLAPYIQVATALIGKARKIGGNQFRHNWSTLGILIDHKIIEPVILKAGLIHDLKEDAFMDYHPEQIRLLDGDGNRVVELVEELSIKNDETKSVYLERVMIYGTREAKIIKLADRISNLIDIQLGTFDIVKVKQTLDETEKYILPYAREINENMYLEMVDLVISRTKYVQQTIELITKGVVEQLKDILSHTIDVEEIMSMEHFTADDIRTKISSLFNKIKTELTSDFIIHNIYRNV